MSRFGGFRGFSGGGGSSSDDKSRNRFNRSGKPGKKDYQDIMEERMAEYKEQIAAEKKMQNLTGTSIPGTNAEQEIELSTTAQIMLEKLAAKKAKKEAKKAAQRAAMKPRNFSNGSMDARGNVTDRSGRVVLKVDMKTGVIKNNMGIKVGKYVANSPFSAFKIERLLANASTKNNNSFFGGGPTSGGGGNDSWFWGGDDK